MPSTQNQTSLPGRDKLWTPANIVTLIRICLVPVFVVALVSPWPEWFGLPQITDSTKSLIAAGIFILISCTDWLDGYLARSRDEITDFGKFMDPLADKILVSAALLALIELGSLPSWVVLVILAREFIVSGVRMMAATEGVVIAASWYGKFKTVFQMIAIVLFTIKDSYMVGSINEAFGDGMWLLSWIIMIIALALTVVSMLDYIAKARHLIGFTSKKEYLTKITPSANTPTTNTASDGRTNTPVTSVALAAEVLSIARAAGLTIGTAESLTGGLISSTLTAIPGSSKVVRGGIVSYARGVKEHLLGIDKHTIDQYGAVSKEVVCAMAKGARADLGVDIAVSTSGIAGPDGAEPGKPVGTVWIGISFQETTQGYSCCFSGDRDSVRHQTVYEALCAIKNALEMQSAKL